jgi:S-adenosylmethionine synthetase
VADQIFDAVLDAVIERIIRPVLPAQWLLPTTRFLVNPTGRFVAVGRLFDLRPAAILEELDLCRPQYLPTAVHGHFGREGEGFSWEQTGRVGALRDRLHLEPERQ